jgi:hypothetical protein
MMPAATHLGEGEDENMTTLAGDAQRPPVESKTDEVMAVDLEETTAGEDEGEMVADDDVEEVDEVDDDELIDATRVEPAAPEIQKLRNPRGS